MLFKIGLFLSIFVTLPILFLGIVIAIINNDHEGK